MLTRVCLILSLMIMTACESTHQNEWDTLDYSRVYKQNQRNQYDNLYEPPSVISCVDDDLYNCH